MSHARSRLPREGHRCDFASPYCCRRLDEMTTISFLSLRYGRLEASLAPSEIRFRTPTASQAESQARRGTASSCDTTSWQVIALYVLFYFNTRETTIWLNSVVGSCIYHLFCSPSLKSSISIALVSVRQDNTHNLICLPPQDSLVAESMTLIIPSAFSSAHDMNIGPRVLTG
jgi:hypothetical protein